MTQAVCMFCGETKFGALVPCWACGRMPSKDEELVLSLALIDRYFSIEQLQTLADTIKAGRSIELPPDMRDGLMKALPVLRRISGIGSEPRTSEQPVSSRGGMMARLKRWTGGALLLAVVSMAAGVQPTAMGQTGDRGIASAWDYDYVLNLIAIEFLPSASRAVRKARAVYWCGTPVLQYVEQLAPDASVPEAELLVRARRLQAHYAPDELASGLAVSEAACKTPGCRGIVPVREILNRLRVIAN